MKKIILIGATLLVTSGAILVAGNMGGQAADCCDPAKCEQGICKPGDQCPAPPECCKK